MISLELNSPPLRVRVRYKNLRPLDVFIDEAGFQCVTANNGHLILPQTFGQFTSRHTPPLDPETRVERLILAALK